MTPFTTVTSVAAPLPEADVDTDILFPARFLVRTEKAGLGGCAFHDRRFDAGGRERPDFVLNRSPYRDAAILVAGANFGCGSSREQAPWALADLGIRAIVAPSFGEIFRANCFANGLLPIVLDGGPHARVLRAADAATPVTVDLRAGTLRWTETGGADLVISFAVPPRQRDALLAGLDPIDAIRLHEGDAIAAFEARQRGRMPWLQTDGGAAASSS